MIALLAENQPQKLGLSQFLILQGEGEGRGGEDLGKEVKEIKGNLAS